MAEEDNGQPTGDFPVGIHVEEHNVGVIPNDSHVYDPSTGIIHEESHVDEPTMVGIHEDSHVSDEANMEDIPEDLHENKLTMVDIQEDPHVEAPGLDDIPKDHLQTHESENDSGVGETKRWPGWPGENVFRMLVPVQKVGGIIGRKGEYIKKITEETKARVKILDGPPGTSERAVLRKFKGNKSSQSGFKLEEQRSGLQGSSLSITSAE